MDSAAPNGKVEAPIRKLVAAVGAFKSVRESENKYVVNASTNIRPLSSSTQASKSES